MEKRGYIQKQLYHFTLRENIDSIRNSGGLIAGSDGFIYMTESAHDACVFINIYSRIYGRHISDYVIIEMNTDSMDIDIDKLYVSYDHNTEYFHIRDNAIMYQGNLELYDAKLYYPEISDEESNTWDIYGGYFWLDE